MRTFKRPMFRKGGNVGDGIMTGIVDRGNYKDGTDSIFFPLDTARGAPEITAEGIDLANPLPKIRQFEPMEYENINIDELVGTPKTQAEYIEELKAGAGEYGGMDPLTSFLLTAGPSVAGATGFADAINKLQPATQQLIKGADAKAKYNRDLRMAATKLAIGAEEKSEDKRFKLNLQDMDQENQVKYLNDERKYNALQDQDKRDYNEAVADKARAYQKLDNEKKQEYEEKLIREGRAFELKKIKEDQEFREKLLDRQLEAEQKLPATYYAEKYYEDDSVKGSNRKKYEDEQISIKIQEKFGSQAAGFINGGDMDRDEEAMLKKPKDKDVGKVFYDLKTGKVKRFRKTTEGYEFEDINLDTFVEEPAPKGSSQKEKDAKIDKRFDFFSDNQKRIIKDIQNKPEDPFPGA